MKPVQHQARKRFGQNFLVDQRVIEKIITAIAPKSGDTVVEIGPGQGALTEHLLAAPEQLHAIELDRDLIPLLEKRFNHSKKLIIHQGDALNFDFTTLGSPQQPLRVVGNLPYNISTPLIFHLLEQRQVIRDMYFMLQKEVVERMAAPQGSGQYGRLSVMCQYYCQVDYLFKVRPGSFNPIPKVDSAIVRLVPHRQLPVTATNPKLLSIIVKTAFQQRRKTLRNALRRAVEPVSALEQLEIDLNMRPENLSVADYVKLANFLDSLRTQ